MCPSKWEICTKKIFYRKYQQILNLIKSKFNNNVIFPDVPKAVADKFIREGNKEKREEIASIRPSGCEAAYPAP